MSTKKYSVDQRVDRKDVVDPDIDIKLHILMRIDTDPRYVVIKMADWQFVENIANLL